MCEIMNINLYRSTAQKKYEIQEMKLKQKKLQFKRRTS